MNEDQNNKNPKIPKSPILHTFKDDVNKYIEEKNISLSDIALKEQKRRKETERKAIKTSYIVIPIFFLVFLLVGSAAIFKFLKKQPVAHEKAQISKPFILSEETGPLYLNGNYDLKTVFRELYLKKYKKNIFTYTPLVKGEKNLGASEFFNNLKTEAPQNFTKSLSDEFTLGFYNNGEKISPALIFKVVSFKAAYKSMFLWEKTLLADLGAVLPSQTKEEISKNSAILSANFKDKVINNLDARVLSFEDNNPILIYGFFSEKFLIITTSEEVFKIATERLKTALK